MYNQGRHLHLNRSPNNRRIMYLLSTILTILNTLPFRRRMLIRRRNSQMVIQAFKTRKLFSLRFWKNRHSHIEIVLVVSLDFQSISSDSVWSESMRNLMSTSILICGICTHVGYSHLLTLVQVIVIVHIFIHKILKIAFVVCTCICTMYKYMPARYTLHVYISHKSK